MYLPVSKRGDDKPLCTAQELILILKVYISDGDPTFVHVLNEIETGLLLPFKVSWGLDVHANLK